MFLQPITGETENEKWEGTVTCPGNEGGWQSGSFRNEMCLVERVNDNSDSCLQDGEMNSSLQHPHRLGGTH